MKKLIASAALTLLTAGSVATSLVAPARTANLEGADHLTESLTTVPTDSELELNLSEASQEQEVASGYICDYLFYPDGSSIYDCLYWPSIFSRQSEIFLVPDFLAKF